MAVRQIYAANSEYKSLQRMSKKLVPVSSVKKHKMLEGLHLDTQERVLAACGVKLKMGTV